MVAKFLDHKNRELKQPDDRDARGGGGTACHIWAIWLCAAVKSILLRDRVYKSERLGLE